MKKNLQIHIYSLYQFHYNFILQSTGVKMDEWQKVVALLLACDPSSDLAIDHYLQLSAEIKRKLQTVTLRRPS